MSTVNGESSELRSHSTGELVKQLSEQTKTLVRKEIELAKAELSQKGKVAGEGAGMFGGAAVLGLLALGTLTTMILALLDKAMDLWRGERPGGQGAGTRLSGEEQPPDGGLARMPRAGSRGWKMGSAGALRGAGIGFPETRPGHGCVTTFG